MKMCDFVMDNSYFPKIQKLPMRMT